MTEIEKMKQYIERTKVKVADRYCLVYPECRELFRMGTDASDGLYDAISLAFDYGRAKGYRAAKAEGQGMTVKEALAMLEAPDEVDMSWDGNLVNFNFRSEIEVEVWGDYVIRKINATGENKFELVLASRPVKKGAVA